MMTRYLMIAAALLATCSAQPVNAETVKSHVDVVGKRIQFCAAASDEAMNRKVNPLDVVAEKLAIVDACFAFLAGRIYQVDAGQPA